MMTATVITYEVNTINFRVYFSNGWVIDPARQLSSQPLEEHS